MWILVLFRPCQTVAPVSQTDIHKVKQRVKQKTATYILICFFCAFFECSLKRCMHVHSFLNNYAVHVYFGLSTSEVHCTNYMQVRRVSLVQQNREKRTYLYNTWEKVWVEMWPVNPSNIDNNFNKLVSDVWWQLLVIWQQIIIEKMTDLSLISSLCSYPLFINEILWYRNQVNNW